MAVCKGSQDTRESVLFLRRDELTLICPSVWDCSAVCATRISASLSHLNILHVRWVHVAYSVQGLYLLPLRAYRYKKRAWHYFLFDLCYYVTILNFIYIWLLPSSPALFVACYCLSHGSLASAVITWRNSLVFHDQDKVTSLFVHIYPPFTFTVIRFVSNTWSPEFPHLTTHYSRHFYPNAETRFPALRELEYLDPLRALLLSAGICESWL